MGSPLISPNSILEVSRLRQGYSNPGNGSQKIIRAAAAKGGHYPYIYEV